jgi:hypothetical protein
LTGSDVVSWSGTGGDGYIVDYSELTVVTGAVPDPGSSLLLMGIGLVGLAWRKWRQ